VFEGSKLQLNVDASAGGSVRVEIQDAKGISINISQASDSDEINGNLIRARFVASEHRSQFSGGKANPFTILDARL